ncbi:4'-phosphopantetheinyl transferase superfamily protein [Flavobacterium sp. GSP14]|uniref:4'-phosphopantetheinyl transferase family protein n=1 Tax=Flavobacterium sp. GSP14 TaxID=3401734 RepID=UPI003AAD0C73
MIGNDVVDLAVAKKESNWQRKGFLDKIFTQKEQLLITSAISPEIMVWNLWSRKEAAYKIYNRETGIRGYFPLQIACNYDDENSGSVAIKGRLYFTKTSISSTCIHTIALTNKDDFSRVEKVNSTDAIVKTNGIPFVVCKHSTEVKPVSISHHGAFWEGITLMD